MERFAPGAWKKTLREQRDQMRVLFQHGHDPELGDKPIAEIRTSARTTRARTTRRACSTGFRRSSWTA